MKNELTQVLEVACQDLFGVSVAVELTRPDEQFGDYATNVALQLAKQVGKNPREIAEVLAEAVQSQSFVQTASVAGPGFLNVTLQQQNLLAAISTDGASEWSGKKVLLEYSCPNAFKELHAGHLYQTIVGDALGKLFENAGAEVYRANFGGDVGLHVAKCMFGIIDTLGGENPEQLQTIAEDERAGWISQAYVKGSRAYEDSEAAKSEITALNKHIYALHETDDKTSPFAQIYWTCRQWSYDYFKKFYASIEVAPFNRYYPESETVAPGVALIKAHASVFTESNGALVYEGEKKGLHTRVFVTSQGIPTYETKDLGVIAAEAAEYPYDQRIIMTGNDQLEYMKVVFAALEDIDAALAAKQRHLTNGIVAFGDGKKMSSRLGNVLRAQDVLDAVSEASKALNDDPVLSKKITLGAVKYSLLKHRLGGDIAFDVNESVSLEGNSGPYLQYAHARARSILRKSDQEPSATFNGQLEASERSLVRKMTEYTEVLERAINETAPHGICTFLYELSQAFNRFYEQHKVIGSPQETDRLYLVSQYAGILQHGLSVLGIDAPDQM